jgi:hypothetical protein
MRLNAGAAAVLLEAPPVVGAWDQTGFQGLVCGAASALRKIKVSGRLSGKSSSRGLVQRLRTLVCAGILAGQAIHLGLRNRGPIIGKEKVYGSIP